MYFPFLALLEENVFDVLLSLIMANQVLSHTLGDLNFSFLMFSYKNYYCTISICHHITVCRLGHNSKLTCVT